MRAPVRFHGRAWWLVALVLTACESAPPAAPRQPTSQPPSSQAENPPPPGEADRPQTNPTAEPAGPEYLTIVERFKPDQRATAEAQTGHGNELTIVTRNVRRLRIDRDRLPLERRRSISLQLDGQGLEWLGGSKVEEFERLDTGQWKPVKPSAAGRQEHS